jgi:hypothetical protein
MKKIKNKTHHCDELLVERKGILINSILNYLEAETLKKNKKLASENLHDRQTAFDRGDMFITLAFMPYEDIKNISRYILG